MGNASLTYKAAPNENISGRSWDTPNSIRRGFKVSKSAWLSVSVPSLESSVLTDGKAVYLEVKIDKRRTFIRTCLRRGRLLASTYF